MKDQLKQITEFLKVTHKVESFMQRNQTCYLIQIKPEHNVDIRDIIVPETTNCGSWGFMWVATYGKNNQGKIMALPKWKRAKQFLNNVLFSKLKSFGFNDEDALIASKTLHIKAFEKEKILLFKGIMDNSKLYSDLINCFETNKSNEFKYKIIEDAGLDRPEDFKTLLKTMEELKLFFKRKGSNYGRFYNTRS